MLLYKKIYGFLISSFSWIGLCFSLLILSYLWTFAVDVKHLDTCIQVF